MPLTAEKSLTFHEAWARATVRPDYDKALWKRAQREGEHSESRSMASWLMYVGGDVIKADE